MLNGWVYPEFWLVNSMQNFIWTICFFKVCCVACSKSCLLFESTMEFKKYDRWTDDEVQALLSFYVEDEIQQELESWGKLGVEFLGKKFLGQIVLGNFGGNAAKDSGCYCQLCLDGSPKVSCNIHRPTLCLSCKNFCRVSFTFYNLWARFTKQGKLMWEHNSTKKKKKKKKKRRWEWKVQRVINWRRAN